MVAQEIISSDETGFMGCMSFTLDEIFERRGPWPEWWWMLPQTSGIFGHQFIEQAVAEDSQVSGVKDHMVISGRVGPNMMINGLYICQEKPYKGKPCYKQREHAMYLFFHDTKKAWAIADTTGSSSPYAYVDANVAAPDQTFKPWQVWSRERQFLDRYSGQASQASFQTDKNLKCLPAALEDMTQHATYDETDAVDVVAVAPQMKEAQFFAGKNADALLVPGTKPCSLKAIDVIRWIKAQKEFIEQLKALEKSQPYLFPGMDPQHSTFMSLTKLRRASEYFLEQLLMAQSKDPDLEWPLGMLLLDVIPVIAKPFVQVCTALDVKLEEMKAELQADVVNTVRFKTSIPIDVRLAVGKVASEGKLANIMQSSLLQVQRYPFYCLAMAKHNDDQQDGEALAKAHDWYDKLAQQCLSVSGKVTKNQVASKSPRPAVPPPPTKPGGLYDNYYYHGRISRGTTTALFEADGKRNGWFLFRKDQKKQDTLHLSYGFNQRLFHVPIKMEAGSFSVPQLNIAESFAQLLTLVKHFSVRRAELQAALTKPCLRKKNAKEEWFEDVKDVEIDLPLGLSFGGTPEMGIFILKITVGGNAAATNQLTERMRIISINGEPLDGLSMAEVGDKLKVDGSVIRMAVREDPLGSSMYLNSVSIVEQ